MKKLTLDQLRTKAGALTANDALKAIQGGEQVRCHDGKCFEYKLLPLDPPPVLKP